MKKVLKTTIIAALISFSILGFSSTLIAQETGVEENYVPISPLPLGPEGESEIDLRDPEGFLTSLFIIFLSVILILAVIRLVICGLQYMLSDSISNKSTSKGCIWSVLGGIAIILLSVLVLGIINPELTQLKFFERFEQAFNPNGSQEDGSGSAGQPLPIQYNCDPNTVNDPCNQQFETQCTTAGGVVTIDPDGNTICQGGTQPGDGSSAIDAAFERCKMDGGVPRIDTNLNIVVCDDSTGGGGGF